MKKRKTTRREFLRGSAARDAVAGRLGDRLSQDGPPARNAESPEAGLLRIGRKAMAAEFELFFNAGQYPDATDAALAALDEVDRIENQLSYFRATSEVSQVNLLAQSEPLPVTAELFELFQLAVRLRDETGGALDVTAGPLSEAWGFSRRKGSIPSQEELDDALARVGSDKLELDNNRQTVRFAVPGMQINLGAVGKGYALDRCAAVLQSRGIGDFVIHGGQSSVLARGKRRNQNADATDDDFAGWTVGVHDPTRHDRRLAEIRLRDRALATSGSEKQFFRYRGRRISHVLDPRTGQPAEGLLSATVVASNAFLADALATALFVLGVERAMAYGERHSDLAVLLVRSSGSRVETLNAGFESGDLKILE